MDKNQCKYLILENSNIKRCKIYNYCKQGKCHCFEDKDFEDAMAKVSTIADDTKVPIKKLEEQILNLSNQIGTSASVRVYDIYNAILAGQDTAAILHNTNNRIGSTNKDERIIPDVIVNDHPSLADIEQFFGEE